METPRNWHEDDRFWELAEPLMFDDNRWLIAGSEVDSLLRLASVPQGATVLDMCCGPGRHCIELAKRGYKVTGVDRTQRYLDRAQQTACGLELELVRDDARSFVRPESFDVAINLYTSFGYFENPEDDEAVARNLARSLKPGGSLIIQTLGKELIASKFSRRDWFDQGDSILLDERRIVGAFEALENRWTLLQGGERHEIGFVVRLYAATELSAMLKRSGFTHVRFFGNLEGLPYDHNANRLVAVARK